MRTGPFSRARRILTLVVLCCLATLGAAQIPVTTYHYDNARTGQNTAETLLAPSNVNSAQFGKLFTTTLDGYVYAQPLYLPNVQNIAGSTHNVVYAATEHDSLYAVDADNGVILWQKIFLSNGVTSVSTNDVSCSDLIPEIGITGTPVIDSGTGTIYVVVKTKENGSFVQRLHALDVATKAEKFGGPVVISGTYKGVSFDPLKQGNRPGLLLENGHVIIAWASHCDNGPYQGWVMSYSSGASTGSLTQEAVFNTEPDTSRGYFGGIWMSGDGVASDASGNLYFATGNGDFNGSTGDYGDSIVKLSGPSGGSFTVADYFTPLNQSSLDGGDTDVGSGGVLLLPDLPGGTQLLVQMGKEGKMYVVNRNNMGKFCSTCSSQDTNIVQEIPGASNGVWGPPTFWNNNIYFGGGSEGSGTDHLKAWPFNANNSGKVSTSPTSQTAKAFSFASASPVVSSNGTSNAILWVLDNGSSFSQVLYAYDATNLGTMLYNSSQAANNRDMMGGSVKFASPVVANGKVYVGSQSQLNAFAPISTIPTAASPTFNPAPNTYSSSQMVALSDTTSGAHIFYTTDGNPPTTSSTQYNSGTPISVTSTTTIKAFVTATGFNNSAVSTGVYTITLPATATPTFNPTPATYTTAQSVSLLDTTSNAIIHYTTDGVTTPTTSSPVFDPNSPIPVTANTTIKAMAVASGFNPSAVATGVYTINLPVTATPTFSPVPANYATAQSVSLLDTTSNAIIHYTTDGVTTPTTSSPVFDPNSPIPVTANTTIKAMAVASGFKPSPVATGVYTISLPATATPTFSPVPANYATAQSVSLFDTTSNAVIHYTTDGVTTPTTSSPVFDPNSPIPVNTNTTIKAMAMASGFNPSAVATGFYTIGTQSVNYAGGFSTGGLAFNGPAKLNGARLSITDGGTNEASSAYYTTPVAVNSFTTDFSFQLTKASADGMAFVLQNSSTTALGRLGGGLGYGSDTPGGTLGIPHSIAIKFDIYSNSSEGTNSTGLYTNGASPTTPATTLGGGVNLKSGDVFNVHLTYDGVTLAMTITDATIPADTFTTSWPIDIPTTIGSATAFAGFTGGTGGLTATQEVITWTFSNAPVTPTPTFSPAPNTYTSAQSVSLLDATSGATLYYTTDGVTTPTTSSAVFDPASPIQVTSNTTIKAMATSNGANNSAVATGVYTITLPNAATPTFNPAPSIYSSAQAVTLLDATSGATIYYTTDGVTNPTTSSAVFDPAFPIQVTKNTTIKAMAAASGFNNSAVATGVYTISIPTAATPTFNPIPATYTSAQSVSILDATSGTTIYYTTDGISNPSTSSQVFNPSTPIAVATSTTIKAMAAAPGFNDSAVATGAYVISSTGNPGPKLVQHTAIDCGTASSCALKFTSATTAGNMIILALRVGHALGNVTVSDTNHNNFVQAVTKSNPSDIHQLYLYYAQNIASGTDTVTVSVSASNPTVRMAVMEYSGLVTSGALDQTASAVGTGTAVSSGNVTTTFPRELLIGVGTNANGKSWTAGSSWVVHDAPANKLADEDQVVTSTTTKAATFTMGSSDIWTAIVATFKSQ